MIFSVTLVTLYGQTRILFAMGRDGLLPATFAKVNPRTMTPVGNTVIVAVVVAGLAALLPLDRLAETVSIGTLTAFIVVSGGVILLRIQQPDLPRGFKVPGYPVTPILSIAACAYILFSLHWYTPIAFQRLGGGGVGLLPGVGSPSQCAERRGTAAPQRPYPSPKMSRSPAVALKLRATELLLFHLVAATLVAAPRFIGGSPFCGMEIACGPW